MLYKGFVLMLIGASTGLAAPQVVLYSDGVGLVVETRTVSLAREGEVVLDLPVTALVDSLVVEGLDFVRIVPRKLGAPSLAQYVGQTVTVWAQGERIEGMLLAVGDGLVVATRDKVVFIASYDRVIAPLPQQGVEAKERLRLHLGYRTESPGPREIRILYLLEGVGWGATYSAELGKETLDLRGLATLVNGTGMEFKQAEVTLVAGQVYRPKARAAADVGVRATLMAAAPEVAPAFEYHRYLLPEPVDLVLGPVVVPLVKAELAYTKAYRFTGGPVEVRVRFTNHVVPLPAGEVRVFDEEGRLFVGAATIGHTPVGKDVELAIGAAFDLTGERVQEKRQRVADIVYRDTWRITLRSAKDVPVEVEVVETLVGTWTILDSTLPYEPLDAQRVLFRLMVPAQGAAEVRYTVEWRY